MIELRRAPVVSIAAAVLVAAFALAPCDAAFAAARNAAAALESARAANAAVPGVAVPPPTVATFSIVGHDPATGEIGVAVQSRVFAVGNGVIWGEAGVGVVATQAVIDVSYGPKAMALLRKGRTPAEVVKQVLAQDPDPDPTEWSKQGRQFSVMNATGQVATHTGPAAPPWAGHKIGAHCSAQGNILAGEQVVDEMVESFETTEGHLSFKLLSALEGGQEAGGDTRGMQSAAMLIVKKNGGVWLNNDVVLRLQVEDNEQPIAELRRLVEKAAKQRAAIAEWHRKRAEEAKTKK